MTDATCCCGKSFQRETKTRGQGKDPNDPSNTSKRKKKNEMILNTTAAVADENRQYDDMQSHQTQLSRRGFLIVLPLLKHLLAIRAKRTKTAKRQQQQTLLP